MLSKRKSEPIVLDDRKAKISHSETRIRNSRNDAERIVRIGSTGQIRSYRKAQSIHSNHGVNFTIAQGLDEAVVGRVSKKPRGHTRGMT